MAYTQLTTQESGGGRVEKIAGDSSRFLLSVPAGRSGQYRLAQLYDYAKKARGRFPHRAPIGLSLSARVSSQSIPGTWGFGFWNDPFGLSPGFGPSGFRFPALPNAAWFFGASKENFLSFRLGPYQAANGFLAQAFRSPRFHPKLLPAGLALPFARIWTRQLLGKVIGERGTRLEADPAQWHHYRLEWGESRVTFVVDDILVFESDVSPHPPLGLVIWIDNQYAAFTPEGKIGFGILENPEPAWLEVREIDLA